MRRRLSFTVVVLTCLSTASCGGSRDAALALAAETIDRQARSASGAFTAALDGERGSSFELVRPPLREVLAGNSSARDAVLEDAAGGAAWRTVVLYNAQRPYTRGLTSDELQVGGCVEYRVSVATLDLLSARPTSCPEEIAAGYDETVRIDLQRE